MPGGGRPRGNEPGGGTMDGKRHQFREARASGRNGHGRRTQMSKKVGVEETRPEGRQWAEWGGGDRGPGGQWTHTAGLLEKPEIRFPAAQQEGLLQTIPTDADLGNLESNASTSTCMPLAC